MSINLTAIFMAIYLFFSGLLYGDQPVKLEVLHCSLDDGAIVFDRAHEQERADQFGVDLNEVSVDVSVVMTYKNVGRPFQLSSKQHAQLTVYQMVDGEKKTVPPESDRSEMDGGPILIRHNEEFKVNDHAAVLKGLPLGSYSVEVTVPDGPTLVYEDILIIR